MQHLHEKLIENLPAYRDWHQKPYAAHVHIIVLAIFLIAVIVNTTFTASQYYVATANVALDRAAVQASLNNKQKVRDLTNSLLREIPRYNEGETGRAPGLAAFAKDRRDTMLSLINSDPQGFLAAALPADVRSKFPQFLQEYLESDVDAEGEITVIHVDPAPEPNSPGESTIYTLDTDTKKRYNVAFLDAEPSFVTGMRVKVKGVAIGQNMVAVDAAAGGSGSGSAAATGPSGEQRTAVILFNFATNATEPWTTTQVASTVFNHTQSTNFFYKENSFNQTHMTGDVFGWFTIPNSPTGCASSYNTWSSAADQAAIAAGVPLSQYSRIIYIWNTRADCTWGGMGTVGGNPSRSWIPGYNNSSIVAHEFGHNLGARHAQWLKCGTKAIDVYANCTVDEYGDPSDVMGNNWTHYNQYSGPRKIGTTWLGTSHMQTVSTSGVYTVSFGETNDASIKVLKIAKPDTPADAYYVSYRQPIGFDTTLPAAFVNGASIHIWNGSLYSQTKLIDTTPGDGSASNAPLVDGRSFYDPMNGITITQIGHSTSTVTLDVQLTAPPCVAQPPTLSISPASQSGSNTTQGSYTVSVRNNDSNTCSSSSIPLVATVPEGWTGTLGSSALSLAPGASGNTTISVQPAPGTLNGTYSFSAQSSRTGMATVSASASFVVFSDTTAPTVTINSPANGSVLKGNTVKINATASDASGIASITIKGDDRALQACSGTTSCNANWQIRQLPAGTHTITATATDQAGLQSTATITVTK